MNRSTTPRPGALLVNLVMHGALGGVDAAAIAGGTIGRESWRGVVIHGIFVTATGWALLGHHRTSRSGSDLSRLNNFRRFRE